jgi:hypothetical protein
MITRILAHVPSPHPCRRPASTVVNRSPVATCFTVILERQTNVVMPNRSALLPVPSSLKTSTSMSSSEDSSIESDGNLDPDVNMLPLDDFEVDVPDEPQPPPNPSTSRRSPSIEDVPDEGDTLPLPPQATSRYTERYAAGKAGKKLEYVRTRFEEQRAKQQQQGTDRWGRFGDRESFDMLKWVVDSVGKGKADEFLKQPWVSCSASLLCLLRC